MVLFKLTFIIFFGVYCLNFTHIYCLGIHISREKTSKRHGTSPKRIEKTHNPTLEVNRAGTGIASKPKERVGTKCIASIQEHCTHLIYLSPWISLSIYCCMCLFIPCPLRDLTEYIWLTSFLFILWLVYIYDYRKIKLFESEQIIDMDP